MNSDLRFFLDISPLRDYAWTGIPTVTAQLARYLLENYPELTVFFYGCDVVLPQFVRIAVGQAPGGYLRSLIESRIALGNSLADSMRGTVITIGIYPNIKPFHRLFDFEMVIIHDLSALLLPEMHTEPASREHAEAHTWDVLTSDLICCVSEATRQDVLRYLAAPAERTFVSRLGCASAEASLSDRVDDRNYEPYVVVLGTIEPRKNIRIVADLLRLQPQLADDVAFFFVGRQGWGSSFSDQFDDIIKSSRCGNRILFTDYVEEAVKLRLLKHAKFAIYPSLFEGFGLPVLECMAVGCPVITSRSSSLVELGLEPPFYFDPLSTWDFYRAFKAVNDLTLEDRRVQSLNLIKKASDFTCKSSRRS